MIEKAITAATSYLVLRTDVFTSRCNRAKVMVTMRKQCARARDAHESGKTSMCEVSALSPSDTRTIQTGVACSTRHPTAYRSMAEPFWYGLKSVPSRLPSGQLRL